MNSEDFITLLKIGFAPSQDDPDKMNPAALVSSNVYDINFNHQILAGLLTTVLEAVVNLIPENEQIEFEKKSIKLFNEIAEERHEHIERYDLKHEE